MATTVDSRRETVSLIGSDKVESTPVYGANDQKIGTVQRVMIDKVTGKVAYAVMSFGGFLGMGEDYYPLPWTSLKYDVNLGGYRVGVTEDQLKGAPKYNRNAEWDWSDRSRDNWGSEVNASRPRGQKASRIRTENWASGGRERGKRLSQFRLALWQITQELQSCKPCKNDSPSVAERLLKPGFPIPINFDSASLAIFGNVMALIGFEE